MTAKRGTLWKTSWRRQKPGIGSPPQDMYWFANFVGTGGGFQDFQQPLASPGIGDTAPPFWIGTIFGSTLPAAQLSTEITRFGAVPSGWTTRLEWNVLPSPDLRALGLLIIGGSSLIATGLPLLGAGVSPPLIRAVVTMLVVEPAPAGPGFRATLWVDGNVRAVADSAVPYSSLPSDRLIVRPLSGFVNSMAGGNALPTTQEIQDWFAATRSALSAQPIPGKTLDQYDAANTPGVVPNPLVNLAGGQNAPLVTVGTPPVPVNILIPATFGY